jgi:hypothetical protein
MQIGDTTMGHEFTTSSEMPQEQVDSINKAEARYDEKVKTEVEDHNRIVQKWKKARDGERVGLFLFAGGLLLWIIAWRQQSTKSSTS